MEIMFYDKDSHNIPSQLHNCRKTEAFCNSASTYRGSSKASRSGCTNLTTITLTWWQKYNKQEENWRLSL